MRIYNNDFTHFIHLDAIVAPRIDAYALIQGQRKAASNRRQKNSMHERVNKN